MSINIIAAIGANNELGMDNSLIWHLPNDLRFFKQMTMDKHVIMGRKTFESLPRGLPGRKMIVISSKKLDSYFDISCYQNLEDALSYFMEEDEDFFIIGGQSIYEQSMPYVDNMYLTHINAEEPCADAYFPYFEESDWNIELLDSGIDNGLEYERKKYVRKKVK